MFRLETMLFEYYVHTSLAFKVMGHQSNGSHSPEDRSRSSSQNYIYIITFIICI